MREIIPDANIPGADPAAVVAQYEGFIRKFANRYIPALNRTGAVDLDDLYQCGRMAVLKAQKRYNPDIGANFLTYAAYWIRAAIRCALGFDSHTGELPPVLASLDEPIPGTDNLRRLDVLPDPDAVPIDEPLINEETRRETVTEVRAAVARLKSDRQRNAIERLYFDGQERKTAAAEMGITMQGISVLEHSAYRKLRQDRQLKTFAVPFFQVGTKRFRSTWTSATEAAVLWKERVFDELYGPGAYANELQRRKDAGAVDRFGMGYFDELPGYGESGS